MFAVQPYNRPERRAFVRLPYETEAHGTTSDAREGTVRVLNVSRIGLRLDVPCLLAVGAPVTLYFGDVYLDEAPVTLHGRVVWLREESVWHQTGIVLHHTGEHTLAAASELFYAAVAEFSGRFEAKFADGVRK